MKVGDIYTHKGKTATVIEMTDEEFSLDEIVEETNRGWWHKITEPPFEEV